MAAFGGGTAFVKPQKIGVRTSALDDDGEVSHPVAKPARNGGDGAFHQGIEGFGR